MVNVTEVSDVVVGVFRLWYGGESFFWHGVSVGSVVLLSGEDIGIVLMIDSLLLFMEQNFQMYEDAYSVAL